MDDEEKFVLKCVLAYVVGGFLTFGFIMNHYDCWDKIRVGPGDTLRKVETCAGRNLGALLGGVMWPVYVAAKISLTVTKVPEFPTLKRIVGCEMESPE